MIRPWPAQPRGMPIAHSLQNQLALWLYVRGLRVRRLRHHREARIPQDEDQIGTHLSQNPERRRLLAFEVTEWSTNMADTAP